MSLGGEEERTAPGGRAQGRKSGKKGHREMLSHSFTPPPPQLVPGAGPRVSGSCWVWGPEPFCMAPTPAPRPPTEGGEGPPGAGEAEAAAGRGELGAAGADGRAAAARGGAARPAGPQGGGAAGGPGQVLGGDGGLRGPCAVHRPQGTACQQEGRREESPPARTRPSPAEPQCPLL